VPLRLEVGPRDVQKGQAFAKLRTGGDKFAVPFEGAAAQVEKVLDEMQEALLARARAARDERTYTVASRAEFVEKIETQPGFYRVPWGGDDADEDLLKEETRATLRCIPLDAGPPLAGLTCPLTGKPSREWAIFARAY
jgi:prolyl-tRNA synthetase